MSTVKTVIKISYRNTSKLICVNIKAKYEDLLDAALMEFRIPLSEGSRKKFTDLDGAIFTSDSLKYTINRSAAQNRILHIALCNEDMPGRSDSSLSRNSTNDLHRNNNLTEFVGRKFDEVFSKLKRIEAKLDKTETTKHKSEPEVQLSGISTRTYEPVAADEVKKLSQREVNLNQKEAKLEEYEIFLKHQEEQQNQREKKLKEAEMELDKLTAEHEARYTQQNNQLKEQEAELRRIRNNNRRKGKKFKRLESQFNEREATIRDQHLTLKKLEEIMDQLAAELNSKKDRLDDYEMYLRDEETKLYEEKSRIRHYRNVAKSKGRQNQMELEQALNDHRIRLKEEWTRLKEHELRLIDKEAELCDKESDLNLKEFMLAQHNDGEDDELYIFLP